MDRAIAYWRKSSDEAKSKGAALVAFGVMAGLRMARDDHMEGESNMMRSQEELLLATARILRAHIKDALSPAGLSPVETERDLQAMDEALAPFDPSPAQQAILDAAAPYGRDTSQMILTYKYRIKDRSARKALTRHAWAVNQVWNYCTAYQRDIEHRYRAGAPKRRWSSHFTLTYLTAGVSKDLGIHSDTISEICRVFAVSTRAARHAPRFRASGGPKRALGWVPFRGRTCKVKGSRLVYYGKQFRIFEGDRTLPDDIRSGCFVEDARGHWYVCFYVEVVDKPCLSNRQVGIDLGLKTAATCSDGRAIEAPKIYRRHEVALAVAQRAGNRRRAAAINLKIKNCRKDFIHKATTQIAREHALIAVGNVSSSQLAKTRMAKSVLDAGWAMFRSQLRYKAGRHGAVYLDIDEKFTTQTCSECGALPPERPKGIAGLGIRAWKCSACGTSHDRDVNAAKNILRLALGAQRRGDESRGSAVLATG